MTGTDTNAPNRSGLIVDREFTFKGQIAGTTIVRRGGVLHCFGQLMGDLIIEEGGRAVLRGQALKNITNRGELILYGHVAGRVIGNAPQNPVGADQIAGREIV